ncbi:MAG: hypothetical protein SNJ57_15820 [Cyanobacteriota bacterium]
MRTGNVLIVATCGLFVLADWSQPGRFRFGFPFITESVRVAQEVPGALRKTQNATLEHLEQAVESIEYSGPAAAAPTRPTCNKLGQVAEVGASMQAIAAFIGSNPIGTTTIDQVGQQLGQPLCQSNPYTLVWAQQGSASSLRVTFQQQGGAAAVVVGYQYDEQPSPSANTTNL